MLIDIHFVSFVSYNYIKFELKICFGQQSLCKLIPPFAFKFSLILNFIVHLVTLISNKFLLLKLFLLCYNYFSVIQLTMYTYL